VDAPAHVVILMESGPAVFLIHEQHIAALASLLNGLAPDDEAALFAYADVPKQIVPFTANKIAIRSSVNDTQYMVGMDQLNFYDSLGAVLDGFPAGNAKEAIVVLSTGLDSSPADHWDLLERKLRGSNVVIFPVALGGELRDNGTTAPAKKRRKKSKQPTQDSPETAAFVHADLVLRSLAQITGGRAYFPRTADDFAPAYREIAAAVRHQYVLGFTPDRDGAFHQLSIEILDDHGQTANRDPKSSQYRALFREGYSAPAP
jgi:VWFA-related protein